MPELLAPLLAAHLLADFVLQPDWLVRRKRELPLLLLHLLVVVALTLLLLGKLHWPILAATFATHLAIDFMRVRLPNSLRSLLIDQLLHLAVIVGLAWYYAGESVRPIWLDDQPLVSAAWYYAALSVVSALVLILPVGGILVGRATEPFLQQIREHLAKEGEKYHEGLTNGGKFIGYLERTVALILFLIHEPMGIGFLIAAKSILRFGEIKERKDRMFAEYVLIGTLLSFTWVLVIAILTQHALHYWFPPTTLLP